MRLTKDNAELIASMARVTSVRRAKAELRKVARINKGATSLSRAFDWSSTPQGFMFWSKYMEKINPNWLKDYLAEE